MHDFLKLWEAANPSAFVSLAAITVAAAFLTSLLPIFARLLVSPLRRTPTDDLEGRTRIREARKVLAQQRFTEKVYGLTNRLLVFFQYVVGGILASSFVQQQLTGAQLGFLGVLVLLAQLFGKHFNPELVARGAMRRKVFLHNALAKAEDSAFTLNEGTDSKESQSEIRRKLSAALELVRRSELDEKEGETTVLDEAALTELTRR